MKRIFALILIAVVCFSTALPSFAEEKPTLRDSLIATIPEPFLNLSHGALDIWLDYWMASNPRMRESEMLDLCFYSYLRAFDVTREQFDAIIASDPEYAAVTDGDAMWELYLSLYRYLDEYPYYPWPPILKTPADSDVRYEMSTEYEYHYTRFVSAAQTIDLTRQFEEFLASGEGGFLFRGDVAYATDGTFVYAGPEFSYDREAYTGAYYLFDGSILDAVPDSAHGTLRSLQQQPVDALARLPFDQGYLYPDFTGNRILKCNLDGSGEQVFYDGRDILIGGGLTVDDNGNVSFRCNYDYSYDNERGTWVSRAGVCVLDSSGAVLKIIPEASELVYYVDPELTRGMMITAGYTYEEGDLNVRNIISLSTGRIIGVIDGNPNVNVSSFAYSHAVSLYACCMAESYTEYLGEGRYNRRIEVYQLEDLKYLYTLTISNSARDGVFQVLSVSDDGKTLNLFFSVPGADGRTVSGIFPIELEPLLSGEPTTPEPPSSSERPNRGPLVQERIESFINSTSHGTLLLRTSFGILIFLAVAIVLFLINEIRKT